MENQQLSRRGTFHERFAALANRRAHLPLGDWHDRLAAAALLVAVLWIFRDAVFRGRVFYWRDIGMVWYPQVVSFIHCFATGAWPLWDPYRGFGQPLLADPSAQVLYPFAWLKLLIEPSAYYTIFVASHFFLSALGVFAFSRRLGTSRVGSLTAAGIWILSGPFLSLTSLWHHLSGAAWIPWVFLSGDRVLAEGRRRDVLAFGAAFAMQLLAGSADMVLLCGVAFVPYALVRHARIVRSEQKKGFAHARRLATGGLLAIGVGCALWLPAADIARNAARTGLAEAQRTIWSLHPLGLIETAWCFRWADTPAMLWSASVFRDLKTPWLPSIYFGIPVLVLVAAGATSRFGHSRVFSVLALAFLLVALGRYGFVYSWIARLLPFARVFRYPVKAMIPVGFCGALLAGIGFDVWARPRDGRPWVWRLGVQWPLIGFVVVSVLGLAWSRSVNGAGASPSVWTSLRVAAGNGAWLLVGLGVGVVTLGLVLAVRRWPKARWAAMVAALALIDLLVAQRNLVMLTSRDMYRFRPRSLEWIDGRRLERVYVDDYSIGRFGSRYPIPRDAYRVDRVPKDWSVSEAQVLGVQMYLNPPAAERFGIYGSYDSDALGMQPWPQVELTEFLRSKAMAREHLKLLQIGAVNFALGLHPAPWWDQLEPVASYAEVFDVPVQLFRVPEPLPRTYVVDGIEIADGEAARVKLLDPAFDPRRTVVLPDGAPQDSTPSAPGSSRIVSYQPDRVVLSVRLERPGVVVLVDAYGAGWTAALDDVAVPVLRANTTFRAVRAPAGEHVVELVYRPAAVIVGLIVAGCAVLVACVMAARELAQSITVS